ncbi:MAG: hypothetical protein JWR26_2648 [Pedosphaera sp.]|nr:hypothetical protein [Pedosphaera sp.]
MESVCDSIEVRSLAGQCVVAPTNKGPDRFPNPDKAIPLTRQDLPPAKIVWRTECWLRTGLRTPGQQKPRSNCENANSLIALVQASIRISHPSSLSNAMATALFWQRDLRWSGTHRASRKRDAAQQMRGNCSPESISTTRVPPTRVFIVTYPGCSPTTSPMTAAS